MQVLALMWLMFDASVEASSAADVQARISPDAPHALLATSLMVESAIAPHFAIEAVPFADKLLLPGETLILHVRNVTDATRRFRAVLWLEPLPVR
jgi:hypothetical protein